MGEMTWVKMRIGGDVTMDVAREIAEAMTTDMPRSGGVDPAVVLAAGTNGFPFTHEGDCMRGIPEATTRVVREHGLTLWCWTAGAKTRLPQISIRVAGGPRQDCPSDEGGHVLLTMSEVDAAMERTGGVESLLERHKRFRPDAVPQLRLVGVDAIEGSAVETHGPSLVPSAGGEPAPDTPGAYWVSFGNGTDAAEVALVEVQPLTTSGRVDDGIAVVIVDGDGGRRFEMRDPSMGRTIRLPSRKAAGTTTTDRQVEITWLAAATPPTGLHQKVAR